MKKVYGKVGNIEFSIDDTLIQELATIHGIDAEAEIKAAIEREISSLNSQYPDAPMEKNFG